MYTVSIILLFFCGGIAIFLCDSTLDNPDQSLKSYELSEDMLWEQKGKANIIKSRKILADIANYVMIEKRICIA